MRSILTCVLFLYACAMLSSCGPVNPVWKKYTSKDGKFSVNMPAEVRATEVTEVTPFGKQTVHYVKWKPSTLTIDKFKLIQVSYTDCPHHNAGDTIRRAMLLDSSINMRKKDFSEKDINSEVIEFNSYGGRSFIYDDQSNQVIVKQFIANGERYDLTVIAKENYGTNADVNNFFNSFQILR